MEGRNVSGIKLWGWEEGGKAVGESLSRMRTAGLAGQLGAGYSWRCQGVG